MSEEIKEKAETTEPQAAPKAEAVIPESSVKKARSTARKKKIRRLIVWLVVLALLGGGGWFGYQRFKPKEAEKEALTDFATVGSITSKVEGSGLTKAKDSRTISITTAGTLIELLVEEGQQVMAGDPLFTIDSPAAETAVQSAKNRVDRVNKQIADIRKDQAGLNLAPTFGGKLVETIKLNPGDKVGSCTKIATIIDDSVMRLTQYYSYAYEGMITKGMAVDVSISALMTSVPGTVSDVRYVDRITPEGSKLFAVEISVPNKGILTKGMKAMASAIVNGESIYPYEEGEFDYNRTGDLTTTVGGTVISCNIYDYLQVSKGQVLLRISGDDSNDQIFDLEGQLEDAQKELDKAQENLDNCRCTAPIDGMIIGLSKREGDEINANEQLFTISDTNTVVITANIDERNISFIKPGMPVNLDQWGKQAVGYVDSVSLQSNVSSGVATYPITIAADNFDGTLQLNSYINYTIEASRSDNCLIVPVQCVYNVMLADESEASIVYVRGDEYADSAVEIMEGNGTEVPSDFYPVQVELGISDTYNVEIKSGLEEGTEVFTQMVTTEVWN